MGFRSCHHSRLVNAPLHIFINLMCYLIVAVPRHDAIGDMPLKSLDDCLAMPFKCGCQLNQFYWLRQGFLYLLCGRYGKAHCNLRGLLEQVHMPHVVVQVYFSLTEYDEIDYLAVIAL